MVRTSLFKSNKTQAVRLPKAVAMPDDVTEVEISIVGSSRIIAPAGRSWDDFFDGAGASEDFMADRAQPEAQERDAL